MSWDIEISTQEGKFSDDGMNINNRLICIGITYGKIQDEFPLQQYCISYVSQQQQLKGDNINEPDIQIIKAIDENDIIQQFAKIIHQLQPCFISGFNDSKFDWKFIKDKIKFYQSFQQFGSNIGIKIKDEKQFNNLFPTTQMKINAGNNTNGITINIPGILCIDTRCLLMKFQNIEKKSLNEYLKANNLPLKLEVSFDVMNTAFRFVDNSNTIYTGTIIYDLTQQQQLIYNEYNQEIAQDNLNFIYKYCVYDSDACRLLWKKRNILLQIIEVCRLSFVPIRTGFMNADGIKVRNMIAKIAYEFGYSVPMSNTSYDLRARDTSLLEEYLKYQGAYVPEPHKGINTTPVLALDFASLYPSIIRAHNLSPENLIEDEYIIGQPQQIQDFINLYEDQQYLIQNYINFDELKALVNNYQGQIYIVKVGTQQQYTFKKCFKVNVNFQKQGKITTIISYMIIKEENEGVYPYILKDLFAKRKIVKSEMNKLEHQIESIDNNSQESQQILQEMKYQVSLLNAKQLAIKIFMNTFYGEAGNQRSPMFDVVIAGGTTAYGQTYIKKVHNMISNNDCEAVAGDTDSIYFRPRISHYNFNCICGLEHNFQFYQLEQYNQQHFPIFCPNKLIYEGFRIAKLLQKQTNDMIEPFTDGILKMEFEELLCPSLFAGKKKYFGAMYEPPSLKNEQGQFIDCKPLMNNINASDKKQVLVKGIDFIKSQYPQLVKDYGYQMLSDILTYFNNHLLNFKVTNLDQLQELFNDSNRYRLNKQVFHIVKSIQLQYLQRIQNLQFNEYYLLSARKKIRDTNGGEMVNFKKRIMDIQQEEYEQLEIDIQKSAIDINKLKELGIEIPQIGELLDIIYVNTDQIQQKIKFKQLDIDINQLKLLSIQIPKIKELFDIIYINTNQNKLIKKITDLCIDIDKFKDFYINEKLLKQLNIDIDKLKQLSIQIPQLKKILDNISTNYDQINQNKFINKLTDLSIEINKLKELYINENQLKLLDIDISKLKQQNDLNPQLKKLFDNIYINTDQNNQKIKQKTSDKMHLLKYAIIEQISLDLNEYNNMFRTSTTRIAMCSVLPPEADQEQDLNQIYINKKFQEQAKQQINNELSVENLMNPYYQPQLNNVFISEHIIVDVFITKTKRLLSKFQLIINNKFISYKILTNQIIQLIDNDIITEQIQSFKFSLIKQIIQFIQDPKLILMIQILLIPNFICKQLELFNNNNDISSFIQNVQYSVLSCQYKGMIHSINNTILNLYIISILTNNNLCNSSIMEIKKQIINTLYHIQSYIKK